ncbi:MAG: leucine-rich repeat domain-containing protein [Clostridia bacterium]|nr:leucine-rich repeat domain-containing protein [Clostridia bacterium]
MKKIIAVCLALAAVLTLFSACGKPKLKTVETKDFVYEVQEDNTAKITAYTNTDPIVVLEIPAAIDDLTVTAIGERAFADHDNLTEVYLPATILTIGEGAFENSSVRNVFLHKARSIEILPPNCFANCHQLVQVDIGNGIKMLSIKAFSLCENLLYVTLRGDPSIIDSLAFDACPKVELRVKSDFKNIIAYAEQHNIKYVATDAVTTQSDQAD